MCAIDWPLLLQYVQVLASWPVVTLILATYFMRRFRTNIANLIDGLDEAQIFGGKFKRAQKQQEQQQQQQLLPPTGAGLLPAEDAEAAKSEEEARAELPPLLLQPEFLERSMAYLRSRPLSVYLEYFKLRRMLNAEITGNRIFGTQVKALRVLRSGQSMQMLDFQPYLDEHHQLAGTTSYTLDRYVGYLLTGSAVIEQDPGDMTRYKLSDFGSFFLTYMDEQYPNRVFGL